MEAFILTRDTVYEQVLARQREQEDMRRQYQRLLDTEKGKTETILNSLAEAVVVVGPGRPCNAGQRAVSDYVRR